MFDTINIRELSSHIYILLSPGLQILIYRTASDALSCMLVCAFANDMKF